MIWRSSANNLGRSAAKRLTWFAGPQPGTVARAQSRVRYAWNYSRHPLSRRVRVFVDTELPGRERTALSLPYGPGVSFECVGVGGVEKGLLDLLEEQRERGGIKTLKRQAVYGSGRSGSDGSVAAGDIVVSSCNARQASQRAHARALVLPHRVHLSIDTTQALEVLRSKVSKRERWQFARNMRTRNWRFEKRESCADFAWFYAHMHLPTMDSRHGERSRSEDVTTAYECLFRHGQLFFLLEDERPVAGALCRDDRGGKTLTTRLLGVLEGREEHYDSGAFKALYHFLMQWACEHDVRELDLHGTEPFVSRGIFQWKRRLAPRVVLPPSHFSERRLVLSASRDSPPIRDFLNVNPLITLRDGQLEPVYFFDADREPRTGFSSQCQGLAPPRLISLDEFLP